MLYLFVATVLHEFNEQHLSCVSKDIVQMVISSHSLAIGSKKKPPPQFCSFIFLNKILHRKLKIILRNIPLESTSFTVYYIRRIFTEGRKIYIYIPSFMYTYICTYIHIHYIHVYVHYECKHL